MSAQKPVTFNIGDTISHPNCPDWGSGKIRETQPSTHEGKPSQRIRVDFKNTGSKWLNTGFAPLELVKRKNEPAKPTKSPRNTPEHVPVLQAKLDAVQTGGENLPEKGWLDSIDQEESNPYAEKLIALPAELDDIFLSPVQRLENAIKTFEHTSESRALFKWACIQTRLDDPLAHFTRNELEEAFAEFCKRRDDLFFDILRAIRSENQEVEAKKIFKACKYKKAKEMIAKGLRF